MSISFLAAILVEQNRPLIIDEIEYNNDNVQNILPITYGVDNSYGGSTSNITYNTDGSVSMIAISGQTMSWGAIGEENVYQEYTYITNNNSYTISVNISELNGFAQLFKKEFNG